MDWIDDLAARARYKSEVSAKLLPKICAVFEDLKHTLVSDIERINTAVGSEVVRFVSEGPHAVSLSCASGEVMSVACFNDVSLQLEIEISAADDEIARHFLPVTPNLNGGPPEFSELGKPAGVGRISQLMIQPLVEYSLQLHEFERPDEF